VKGLLILLVICLGTGLFFIYRLPDPNEPPPEQKGVNLQQNQLSLAEQQLQRRLIEAERFFSAQDWSSALQAYESILEDHPNLPIGLHRCGYALHALGRLDEAIRYHEKSAATEEFKMVGLYNLACAYSLKKDKTKAFAYLRQATEAGFVNVKYMEFDTDLDFLRSEPEYAQLRSQILQRGSNARTNP
jgi:tetratricopeptide (TPR) repeat protein